MVKVAYYDSPIGLIELQADQGELLSLQFQEVKRYQEKETNVLAAAKKQLHEYFEGERKEFKLPVIIPCHRVTASSGKIGGYGAGIWRKKWLLEHENKVDSSGDRMKVCSQTSWACPEEGQVNR